MDVNVLIRGQSNALLFADRGGPWALEQGLEAQLGVDVHMLYEWGTDSSTIHSGTAFMSWDTDGQQASLLNYVRELPADIKDNPTAILWMHNEYDQNDWSLTKDSWLAEVQADAAMLRDALGQGADTTPYTFVPIRYPYGGNFAPIGEGMAALDADPDFNAEISWAAESLAMDGGPEPGNNGSHMGDADAVNLGNSLVAGMAETLRPLANGSEPVVEPPTDLVPTPVPPDPRVVEAGSGPDELVLRISQDAYEGSAEYTVSVDGAQVGGTFEASAWRSAGQSDTLTLRGDWGPGEHRVEVRFLNDRWDGSAATDRNLHLDGAAYNGQALEGASAALMDAGAAAFSFAEEAPSSEPVAPPPPADIRVGDGPDALVLAISQDAYDGPAQYTVSVDGAQVGETFTASAWRSAGQSDTLTLRGDWGPGEHSVEVRFLNDAWGGTADTDRNLHLDGATYNGQALGGAPATLWDAGSAWLAFAEEEAEPGPVPVVRTGTDAADLFEADAAGGTFTGGGGRDLFLFEAGDGHVTVTDFAPRADKLVFVDFDREDVAAAAATRDGADGLLVTYGGEGGGTVFLAGVAELGPRDLAFG